MKVIIIDDEALARNELKYLLSDKPNVKVVAEAGNANEAIELIHHLRPDLIFLDIEMPEKSGFDLLEELDYVPQVIFVTAFDQFAIKAFESNALDYILKPIHPERLQSALAHAQMQIEAYQAMQMNKSLDETNKVFIKDGDKCYFVRLDEVFMISSLGNYARIHFGTSAPLIHKSLNLLEKRLPTPTFFRANRQQIININYIQAIDSYFKGGLRVQLQQGVKVEISNRQAVRFKELLSL